ALVATVGRANGACASVPSPRFSGETVARPEGSSRVRGRYPRVLTMWRGNASPLTRIADAIRPLPASRGEVKFMPTAMPLPVTPAHTLSLVIPASLLGRHVG